MTTFWVKTTISFSVLTLLTGCSGNLLKHPDANSNVPAAIPTIRTTSTYNTQRTVNTPQSPSTAVNTAANINTTGARVNAYPVAHGANTQVLTSQPANTQTYYNYDVTNAASNAATQTSANIATNTASTAAVDTISYYDYGVSSNASAAPASPEDMSSYNSNGYQGVNSIPVATSSAAGVSQPDGRPSVQVIAASDYNKAVSMRELMLAEGFSAVIVQIDGLYKVRVPFGSYQEASSQLGAIRSRAPDAFVAMR